MRRQTGQNELYPRTKKLSAPFHEADSPRLDEKDDVCIYPNDAEMRSRRPSILDEKDDVNIKPDESEMASRVPSRFEFYPSNSKNNCEESSTGLSSSPSSRPISVHSDITQSSSHNLSKSKLVNEEKTTPQSYSQFLQEKLNILGHPSADDLLLFFGGKLLGKPWHRNIIKESDDTCFLYASKHKSSATNVPNAQKTISSDSGSSAGAVTIIRDIIRRVYNTTIDSTPVKSQQGEQTRSEGSVLSDFWMNLNRWIQPVKDERYIVHKDEDEQSADTSRPLSQNSIDSYIQLFHPALASLYRRAPKLVQSFDKDLLAVQTLVRGFKVISKYFTNLIALVQTIRGTINKDVREAGQQRDNLEEYIKETKTWEEAGFDEEAAREIVRVCGVKLTILESRIGKLLKAYERKDVEDEKAYLGYLRTQGKV